MILNGVLMYNYNQVLEVLSDYHTEIVEDYFDLSSQLRRAKEAFNCKGVPSVSHKFTISPYDFYLHVAQFENKIHFMAITCSGLHEHNIREMIEVICRQSTRALRRGAYTVSELTQLWRGYSFSPFGVCPQLAQYGFENLIAKSPLDAAAKILQARYCKKEL